jgi:hypothetical protein
MSQLYDASTSTNLFEEDIFSQLLGTESDGLTNTKDDKILNFETEGDTDGLSVNGSKRVSRPVDSDVNASKSEFLPGDVDNWMAFLDISDNSLSGTGAVLDPTLTLHNHALEARLSLQGANSPNPRDRKRNKSISGASGGQRLGKEDTSQEEEEVVEEGHGRLHMSNPYEYNPALYPEGAYEALAEATAFAESSRSFVYPYASHTSNTAAPSWYPETTEGIKAEFGINPKAEQFMQKPNAMYPPRRRPVSARPPTYNAVPGFALREHQLSSMRATDNEKPELDANYVKLALMDLGYPATKKDPKGFCNSVVNYICEYAKIFVGGTNNLFYRLTITRILFEQ